MNITVPITKEDCKIVYTRIVNNILENLPENYIFLDDIFELKNLTERIDRELRKVLWK